MHHTRALRARSPFSRQGTVSTVPQRSKEASALAAEGLAFVFRGRSLGSDITESSIPGPFLAGLVHARVGLGFDLLAQLHPEP